MDADLFASKKKPSSAPTQTKLSANKPEGTDEPTSEWKKPSSAPSSTIRSYKKPTLSVDPLADLLDDLSLKETKAEPEPSTHKAKLEKSVLSPAVSPIIKREKVTTPKKQDELTFDDDDDLMTFDTENYSTKKKESVLSLGRESREPPQKTRTKLDEILERGTSPRHLERPPTGERKDQPPLQKQQQEKTSTTKEPLLEDDLTFGSYQPTLSSTPEGRQSRRQSVRFSKEDVSASSPEKKPKSAIPATPTTPTSTRPRSSADWLGLKTNDEYNYLEDETKEQKTPKTPSSAVEERGPSLTGTPENKVPMPEVPKSQKKDEEEDDWLTGVLSRKKGLVASNSEARRAKQEDSLGLGEEMNLESIRTLQLERDQSQMLLENVQQRHKQDVELLENTHKARVKLLEESAAQREARAQQECEDLMERLATVTRLADQERSELQAQHQRRLAQSQQDRDREVERLRDLQRKSILEMKKDHEDQVQRLKRLKDEEIDAVTSATSQTRSLTVVIEQMEQFSVRLGDLSSRVESTHEHTAQGLEQGARQRDEQLRMLQERLGQQQRAMAEERAQLKEVIARMNTQLAEQQRQLEKERWKVTAEQAKAESIQRGLEEEKRSLTMHINMEREELERAKTALLEEQQSVMQHCTEERRKLAAEWAQFHTQEKQRQERAEREASKALERDAQREGSIISLAQEQADLKLRAGELKQKEAAVLQDREALERQREELGREKERLSITAVRLKTRAQEVETFSKLATDKYEEGEQALQRATHIETEHKARLTSIHSQTERLRQQEQQLLQVCVPT
uniref:Fas-binding factor 1 C-terminal domain-containing protein n=1 Tax=Myripristis murdjan TaxID=586833 RepID=A0A667X434_9TELE